MKSRKNKVIVWSAVSLVVAFFLATTAAWAIQTSYDQRVASQQSPKTTAQVVSQPPRVELYPLNVETFHKIVNEERAKAGLPPVELDERLSASAQAKAEDMSANGFGHINPKTGKHGYEYTFEKAPQLCSYASENIAAESIDSRSTVDAWMNSPSHRAAILDARYDRIGYGISGGMVAQHFCDLN